MIRKPKPGNPRPAIDPDKSRRIRDFTRLAVERVDRVLQDISLLIVSDEMLVVATNVAASVAVRTAVYARDTDLVENPDELLKAVGLHIAGMKTDDFEGKPG